MTQDRETTEIFGRCYRLMHRLGAAMSDRYFADLWSRESDSLLSDFIIFLKKRWETLAQTAMKKLSFEPQPTPVAESSSEKMIYSKDFVRQELASWQSHIAQCSVLQHQDIAKHLEIVQHAKHVAQSREQLAIRIRRILELLAILSHVGQITGTTPLLLERELLKLRLAVLNSSGALKAYKASGKRVDAARPEATPDAPPQIKLDHTHKQILQFIKSKTANGGEVQNTEIFTRFHDIHRRTIKRKLSDLTTLGHLKRMQKGKSVYYKTPAPEPESARLNIGA